MLRSLELREIPDGEVLISTDVPGNIHGDDFPNTTIPVRVFNSDFVRDNVFSIEGKDIPPIIVLGTEDKEKRDKLEEKKAALEQAEMVRDTDYAKRKSAEDELDSHCKTRGLLVKRTLEGPGEHNNYGRYNKRKYRIRAEEMLDEVSVETDPYDNGVQDRMLAMHRAVPKPRIPEPSYPRLDLAILRDKVAGVLACTVVSETIQSLKDDPERSEWVRKGLGLQAGRECPFCEQRVPERRQVELEHHFSSTYERLMESLNGLAVEIDGTAESYLPKLAVPARIMIHDHLFDGYRVAKAALEAYRNQVKKYLDSLAGAVKHKRGRPFDAVPMDGVLQPPDDSPIDDLLWVIHQHNDMCDNRAIDAAKAGEWLERRYVAENMGEFRRLRDTAEATCAAADRSEERVSILYDEVSILKREVSDHGRSADAFNAALRAYLGHGELQLDVRENGYVIMREGDADPLPSEGEKTAIALLYFLTSLHRDGFNIGESVIVLDDPVSSLDASSLFAAYGFIREHTNLAGQLFILTHNFTFFREVRGWFSKKKHRDGSRRAQFYMLNSSSDGQGRRSEMQKLDPLLKDYGSDYHYLFARVWRGAQQKDKLESYYPLPNMARRLLDAFLAFRLPDIHGTLGDRMDIIDFDEGRKRRMLAFANAYSHNDAIAEQEHNAELLGETPEVLSDIMDLIKSVDSEHYDRMAKLAGPA